MTMGRGAGGLAPADTVSRETGCHKISIAIDAMANAAKIAYARCRRERSCRTIFKIAARSGELPVHDTDRTSSRRECISLGSGFIRWKIGVEWRSIRASAPARAQDVPRWRARTLKAWRR